MTKFMVSPSSSPSCGSTDVTIYSFAILLPPLGVFLERGCNSDFLINILLVSLSILCTLAAVAHGATTDDSGLHVRVPRKHSRAVQFSDTSLSRSPGIIHALYIILKY